ncbi:MAG TPA: hypothetical protein V6C84_16150 [Coleofasciculaceae cyanobacterium]
MLLNSLDMAGQTCAIGYNCAAMMQQPGLEAQNCDNYMTCFREARGYLPQPSFSAQEYQESLRVEALQLLNSRVIAESPRISGLDGVIVAIGNQLQSLRSRLSRFATNGFVAPDGCEVSTYSVTRPSRTYRYNKLSSQTAMFLSERGDRRVKTMHLGDDNTHLNREARAGIDRRNRLNQAMTQLQIAQRALEQAATLLDA